MNADWVFFMFLKLSEMKRRHNRTFNHFLIISLNLSISSSEFVIWMKNFHRTFNWRHKLRLWQVYIYRFFFSKKWYISGIWRSFHLYFLRYRKDSDTVLQKKNGTMSLSFLSVSFTRVLLTKVHSSHIR
jgi:hypothetical protein